MMGASDEWKRRVQYTSSGFIRKQETEAATLQIMFVGKEHSHVHWTTTHTSGSGKNRRTTTRHHHAYRDRTLVAIDVPLGTFPDGVVRPGNYEFPFSATLPDGYPS